MPEPPWDALYLSPHLDDAVLSCGGQIELRVRRGERVLIVTLFTGEPSADELPPLARKLHEIWDLSAAKVMSARRGEDRAAVAELGAELEHWPLVDAVYRRDPATGEPLYPSLKSLFGRPIAADDELLEEIAERFAPLAQVPEVFAPLGIGGHADHRLCRRAAERVFGERLELYEDFPYAEKRRHRWAALWRRYGLFGRRSSRAIELDVHALEARCRATACYTSQLDPLFGGREAMERRTRAYVRRRGGERLWRR